MRRRDAFLHDRDATRCAAAVAVALACACTEDPPAVRLVVRAETGAVLAGDEVEVAVSARAPTAAPAECGPCIRAFPIGAGGDPMPIVVEFVAGRTPYVDVAFRIVVRRGASEIGRLFRVAAFPESGLRTAEALLETGCIDTPFTCGSGMHCAVDAEGVPRCVPVDGTVPRTLEGAGCWTGASCSDSCDPPGLPSCP